MIVPWYLHSLPVGGTSAQSPGLDHLRMGNALTRRICKIIIICYILNLWIIKIREAVDTILWGLISYYRCACIFIVQLLHTTTPFQTASSCLASCLDSVPSFFECLLG